MSVRISFKLPHPYSQMALQLEQSVDKEGWEIYESQVAIRNRRIEEHKAEVMEKGESSVEIPGIPFPPLKLTKEEICRRVFIKWMESQLVSSPSDAEQYPGTPPTELRDDNERTGDTEGDPTTVSDSQDVNSTALAQSEESAATA